MNLAQIRSRRVHVIEDVYLKSMLASWLPDVPGNVLLDLLTDEMEFHPADGTPPVDCAHVTGRLYKFKPKEKTNGQE